MFSIFLCVSPAPFSPPSILHWSPLHVVSSSDFDPGPAQLPCHARGFPPPVISWSRLNVTFSPSPSPSLSPLPVGRYKNGTLLLKTLERNQDMTVNVYRCEAKNEFGTVAMETIVYMNKGESVETSLFQVHYT